MPFRILNPFPVFLGSTGRPAAGGYLRFFESGTDTEKSVYGDPGLTTDNGSTIAIKPDGRTVNDIWGDGSYRVRLYASDDTLIAEADDVEVTGGTGAEIPALVDGYFLTNNGALMLWAPIIQVPDPTGQSGKQLGTDGENLIWEPKPTIPTIPPSDIVVTANSFKAGTHFEQWGNGTCPPSGIDSAYIEVTFPTVFTSIHGVHVQVTMATVNGTALVATGTTNVSTSGFRAEFNIADRHFYQSFITSPVTFFWRAIGTKAAATP